MKVYEFLIPTKSDTEFYITKSFTVGEKYRIPSWREDYYIYFVEEDINPRMEDGNIALLEGWYSVINKFVRIQ